jgi:diamine N-acetyltransferase
LLAIQQLVSPIFYYGVMQKSLDSNILIKKLDMLLFKKVTPADIAMVETMAAEIWAVCYREILTTEQINYMLKLMYSKEVISGELATGVVWEIIKTEDGLDLGFLSMSFDSATAKLNKLYLKSDFQGKGYGNKSLEHAKIKALENGCNSLYLAVNKKNHKAIKAYERAGLKCTQQITTDIGNGFVMDDFIYTIEL